MNAEKLMECLGGISDEYIREAAPGKRPAGRGWRALAGGLAAAAVLVLAVAASAWAAGMPFPWAEPDATVTAGPGPGEGPAGSTPDTEPGQWIGDVPGHIHWRGSVYVNRGTAVYEMPEGLELLGETEQVAPEGGIVPEDAGDLSANMDGYVYWFPGNESLLVFCYRDWDSSYAAVELGRQEPIVLMFRERTEEQYREAGYACCSLSELVDASYVILEGEQAALEQSGGGPDGSGEDVYTVRVAGLLRGSVGEQETIRITVPAGSGRLESSAEGSYLLFLRGNGDLTFRPVSERQGVYPIVNKRVYVPVEDPGLWGVIVEPYTHRVRAMALVREDILKAAESAQPGPRGAGTGG